MLTMRARSLLRDAASFFVGHTRAVGVLFIDGNLKNPMFLRSGHEGGPWGGSHRGGIPRLPGWGFTMGAAHEGNISTHVEGHASAILWQRNIKLGYLLVDRAMCKVCDRYLYTTLPPNSTLLVYSEDEGKTVVSASHGS
jgi:hypothetical protein